jgi:hypothetical protein
MRTLPNDDFAKRLFDIAKPQPFDRPAAYYNRAGDCIEFLAKPDRFYATRVDDLVTVYYSEESGEVIGSVIKGIRDLLAKHPSMEVIIQSGRVQLSHLFIAGAMVSGIQMSEHTRLIYRELIQRAEESQVEAEICTV